jgi:hypothetical protein
MHRITRSKVLVATVAAVLSLALGASSAWSDGMAAGGRAECPVVGCVESQDTSFCLCRSGADVTPGERAVTTCTSRPRGACCVSPVGFCYCSAEPECTYPEDRLTDRCDANITPSPVARCALDP